MKKTTRPTMPHDFQLPTYVTSAISCNSLMDLGKEIYRQRAEAKASPVEQMGAEKSKMF